MLNLQKAINVEVSRLLGWIRNKSDIAAEFPDELAKGAEKYFNCNVNYTLTNSTLYKSVTGITGNGRKLNGVQIN